MLLGALRVPKGQMCNYGFEESGVFMLNVF
jgi:hypothetical protein